MSTQNITEVGLQILGQIVAKSIEEVKEVDSKIILTENIVTDKLAEDYNERDLTQKIIKKHLAKINKMARKLAYKNYEEMYDVLTTLGIKVSNANSETDTNFPYYTELALEFTANSNISIKNHYLNFSAYDLNNLFKDYYVCIGTNGAVYAITFCD